MVFRYLESFPFNERVTNLLDMGSLHLVTQRFRYFESLPTVHYKRPIQKRSLFQVQRGIILD